MQVVRFVDLNDEAIAALQAALQVQVQQPPRRVTFLGCPDSCSSAMQEVQQRIEVCEANISHHLVSFPFASSSGGVGLWGGQLAHKSVMVDLMHGFCNFCRCRS